MTPFGAFLAKEFHQIRRTWRIWVLPGMILFFAVASPIIALLTPALVKSFVASQPGVTIDLPDPTATDAYAQFLKNLTQIVLIAVIIVGAGLVSGERRSGTAVLVLTKPLSRRAFVVAKVIAECTLIVAATVVGVVVCGALTTVLFGASPVDRLVAAVVLWLAMTITMVSIMTWLSVALESTSAAAGIGLGIYFVLLIGAAWAPASTRTFVGLGSAAAAVLAGRTAPVTWPLITAAFVAVGCCTGAVLHFERQEI